MADTGWKVAGTGTNVAAGGGDYAWGNPSNITNTTASTAIVSNFSGTSQNLRASNFGFSIPAELTITGVEARIRRMSSFGYVQDENVRLIVAGAVTGTDKVKAGKWTAVYTISEYGGESDLWGTTLTPAQVNASSFGVQLSVLATGKDDAMVQTIWMRIHYEESGNFFERVAATWRKGQLSERVAGVWRPGKLYERVGGIWRS